jgi:hypothetical protein
MTDAGKLDNFLNPDLRDVGCGETLELLDVYVDLLLSGVDPDERYPGITAHLRDCHPCRQDLDGLIAAARRGAE